jgi:RNA polymerase sigma factor (sigma-70 family)
MLWDELEQYRAMRKEIEYLVQEVALIRSGGIVHKWPDGQPYGNYVPDHTGVIAAAEDDLCAVLDQQLAELARRRAKIEKAIWRLPSKEKQIIRLRYFHALSWREIAEHTMYSRRWIQELHRRVIIKLTEAKK